VLSLVFLIMLNMHSFDCLDVLSSQISTTKPFHFNDVQYQFFFNLFKLGTNLEKFLTTKKLRTFDTE
jgi:hypothetical protein